MLSTSDSLTRHADAHRWSIEHGRLSVTEKLKMANKRTSGYDKQLEHESDIFMKKKIQQRKDEWMKRQNAWKEEQRKDVEDSQRLGEMQEQIDRNAEREVRLPPHNETPYGETPWWMHPDVMPQHVTAQQRAQNLQLISDSIARQQYLLGHQGGSGSGPPRPGTYDPSTPMGRLIAQQNDPTFNPQLEAARKAAFDRNWQHEHALALQAMQQQTNPFHPYQFSMPPNRAYEHMQAQAGFRPPTPRLLTPVPETMQPWYENPVTHPLGEGPPLGGRNGGGPDGGGRGRGRGRGNGGLGENEPAPPHHQDFDPQFEK